MTPREPEALFGPHVIKTTTIGAVLGMVGVVVAFVGGVLVTGSDVTTIGAAGLVAPFGGAGFGAMIGAVLGAIEVHEAEEPERRAAADRRRERARAHESIG